MTGASMLEFKIQGADNFKKNLRQLEQNVQLKTARAAARKAANVIRDAAKANAEKLDDPETSQSIAANIAVQQRTKELKRTGDLVFSIGVRGGSKSKSSNEKNPGGDTFYWRFIELGTSKLAATPFLQPAMKDNIAKATNTFVMEFEKGIARAVKRMKKQ